MMPANQYTQTYFNLIIDSRSEAWESGVHTIDRDRFLESTYGNKYESVDPSLHGKILEELIQYPCLFLYEEQTVRRENISSMGYIGIITYYNINSSSITINYVTKDELSMEDILTIKDSLQINRKGFGLNRSHWSVKDGNIFNIIESYRPLLQNKSIATKPRVFFSYSWDKAETKEKVDKLESTLSNQGIEVIYDKNSLRPGHSLNYFMECIRRDKFDKIYIFCDSSYIDKANNRTGGVGKEVVLLSEYVYNHPIQTKVIPIFIEENVSPPFFLTDTYHLNLHHSNWNNDVDKILEDIFY